MRELIDCHIHTERCGHGTGTVAQMVGAAVFRGLSGIVMTEHLPLPTELDPTNHLSMPCEQLEPYAEEVREQAARVKGLDIVLGAEADWLPGREQYAEEVRAAAAELGVAVLLGSVHFIEEWAFDDPHNLDEWDARDIDTVWEEYFAQWCEAAESGLFDVMAHPDLVKKFGHRPNFDPCGLYDEAAAAAARGGVLIEVSTAGLRKPVGELYPGPELLASFRERGVGATVGSDAHATDEVGYHIEDAYRALADAGYEEVRFPMGAHESRSIAL
jgi:histidinol-phosphatase (PHP family)